MKRALCLSLCLASPPAFAQQIDGGTCADVAPDSLRAHVQRELSDTTGAPARLDAIAVSLRCDGAMIEVRVDDARTRKTLLRTIARRDDGADARDRELALAISELVAASWLELALSRTDERVRTQQRRAVVAQEPLEVVSARAPSWWFVVAPSVTTVLVDRGAQRPFWGARLSMMSARRTLRGTASIAYESGASLGFVGELRVDVVSASASVAASYARGDWDVGAGAGARGGVALFSATPFNTSAVEARAAAGGWIGPAANVWAAWTPSARLGLRVHAESGYALVGTHATVLGRREASMAGGWFAADVGLLVGW